MWHTKHPGIHPVEHWEARKTGVPDPRLIDPLEVDFEHPWILKLYVQLCSDLCFQFLSGSQISDSKKS